MPFYFVSEAFDEKVYFDANAPALEFDKGKMKFVLSSDIIEVLD